MTPSREVEIDPAHAALLFIDVQNYTAGPDGGEYAHLDPADREARYGWFFRTLRDSAVPNMQRLQAACRRSGIEVLYTTIESLTRHGRDRSLDYKISGLHVPKGSWDARVIDQITRATTRSCCPRPPPPCSSPPTSTTCCATSASAS